MENKAQLNTINQELNEALEFEIRNRMKTDQIKDFEEQIIQDFFQKVNNLIQILHAIGIIHNQQIDHFRKCNIKIKMPEILSEIFEIESGPISIEAVKSMLNIANAQVVKKRKLATKTSQS